ncbi:16S rRNA methyltransferase [Denitrobacterium detoxificans]|uniref:16S rRNA (Adenine1518-N6/adenine1519-N6)-dimethyltransferase n=1 Tax=Denitrobacterium detoxificans TaxID=79604 RepID=A0A172RWX8_9ACTN|nr:16S rRNA (adenine(1518)-N(6)/adenine(1519)-N(6))-dimethyltransferase RsmA [Denitrobacterium detoxificans]ANE22251.1 16S rRNA methyltransferase [Denitrobacterium detoxificans]SEO63654.1 16S rRNA (adenine1518-N6/adenine1519-N6)-dimethyltransferase [Denitrobacterium detoxificans]
MADKLSPLASVSATRDVLDAHGLATKKALGQHFLINDGVVSKICDLAELGSNDVVLEVGPGIGTLTIALLRKAGTVISVERDTDLPAVLARTCAPYASAMTFYLGDEAEERPVQGEGAVFSLISKDALELQPGQLPAQPNKLVANLPYAVAATLVLDAFQRYDSLVSATVMVQAEVADRMAAHLGTKNYGGFTVKLGLYARPAGRFSVSPGNFFPPPRVDSSVIRLDRVSLDELGITEEERRATAVMADAAFATRRKTILNSSRTYFSGRAAASGEGVTPDDLREVFAQAGIDASRRGESLSLQEFIQLGRVAHERGIA